MSCVHRPVKQTSFLLAVGLVGLLASYAAETLKPITYHFQIAQYADTFGKKAEYAYVLGEVVYRSCRI